MKQRAFQAAFPAAIVLMVTFLFTIFFADVNIASAATSKTKTSAVAKTSAVDHAEDRIKQLQGALKITAAQEELWKTVTEVMRENAKNMDAFTKERAERAKAVNSVERMKLHSEISEVRLEHMKKFIPPFEALYNSMTDEQRKTTDAIFQTGKHGKHRIK